MLYSKNLEAVIAGESSVSNVEGDIGRLTYRGYPVEELVEQDYCAVMRLVLSAGIGALFSVLHGGADEAALKDARKVDPRVVILKPMAETPCRGTSFQQAFDTLAALEAAFNARMDENGKEVWANLEFCKGAVYEALGIPSRYFTATFALSRANGFDGGYRPVARNY